MPVEVIDLLSSSSPERGVRGLGKENTHTSAKENVNARPSIPASKNGGTKKGKDDWFNLSSDSELDTTKKPIRLAPVASSKAIDPPPVSSKPIESLKSNTNKAGTARSPLQVKDRGNGVFYNTDEFDSTIDLDESFTIPRATTSSNRPSVKVTDRGNDVFYNSDEFDSTVDFDDSWTFSPQKQPPRKRRRLSTLSLSASPEGVKLPKTKAAAGLQKAVSYAEKTTSSYKPAGVKSTAAPSLQRSRTVGAVLESDPIVFTSSPDPFEDIARRRRERERMNKREREKEKYESDDDIFGLGSSKDMAVKKKRADMFDILDGSSDVDLPDLTNLAPGGGGTGKSSFSIVDDYYAERERDKKARDALGKGKERQTKKAMKDADKEKRRLEREEKASEKERLAELARVNVVRSNKQRSSHEMMVDIPSKLLDSALGQQAVKLLDKAEIKHSTWQSDSQLVKWRREVTSDYNEEAEQWEPVPSRVELEKHIMCVLTAKEFVELAIGDEGEDVDSHVLGLKAKFPTSEVIYLIEGLTPWMRKNRNIQNKRYTESVRSVGHDEPPTASQRSRKKQEEYVDEDKVEDALLRLQLMHGALIHHTSAMVETAEWILVFTQHISTVPYRRREQAMSTTFCMDAGQVRRGDDAADTFVRMLQEMTQITAAVAYGIAAEYPTVRDLAAALRRDGPLALQDCRKTANKNGSFTDRRVGPSISKRLHKVFTSDDEWSLNV